MVADGVTMGLAVGCSGCCGMDVVVVVDIISASVCEDDMQADVANVILCIMLFAGVDTGAAVAAVVATTDAMLLLQASPPLLTPLEIMIGDCCIYSPAELLYDI